MQIAENIINNDKRAVSRGITYIESDYPQAEELILRIFPHTGNAYRIGITGPPGAGKSTLTNQLTKYYRAAGKKVGIIAVDPTSPFTGGALLGDRVRMNDIGRDEGVFIRSMATRGSLGGLCKKAIDAADVLDAAGYDIILFETVGVGQSELDIVNAADTTLVALVPESGDSVQAMKAGLMEIADLFVLNKSDRPGADQAVIALQTIMMLKPHDEHTFLPQIVKTVAVENKGIEETALAIEAHKTYMVNNGKFEQARKDKLAGRIKLIVEEKLIRTLWKKEQSQELTTALSKGVEAKVSPYELAEKLLHQFTGILAERN